MGNKPKRVSSIVAYEGGNTSWKDLRAEIAYHNNQNQGGSEK